MISKPTIIGIFIFLFYLLTSYHFLNQVVITIQWPLVGSQSTDRFISEGILTDKARNFSKSLGKFQASKVFASFLSPKSDIILLRMLIRKDDSLFPFEAAEREQAFQEIRAALVNDQKVSSEQIPLIEENSSYYFEDITWAFTKITIYAVLAGLAAYWLSLHSLKPGLGAKRSPKI